MRHYDQIFRVRIHTAQRDDVAKGLTRWLKSNRWGRPGEFYRQIIELGLGAIRSQK